MLEIQPGDLPSEVGQELLVTLGPAGEEMPLAAPGLVDEQVQVRVDLDVIDVVSVERLQNNAGDSVHYFVTAQVQKLSARKRPARRRAVAARHARVEAVRFE